MDAERILRLVRGHLDRLGGNWALAGGFALQALGFSRFTRDLDVVVEERVRSPLLSALTVDGFETLFTSAGFSNLLHPDPGLGRLDLIWLDGETSDRVFAGCRDVEGPGGVVLRVPRPEHLIAMKVSAIGDDPDRGLRDLADLQFLLALPGLDDNEVRGYFEKRELADLLERLKPRR
jgi:hypothetical protein